MAYGAEVLVDSINSRGNRLTTLATSIPRPVLAEFNTHRMLSRNSGSSRAIPVEKQISRVLDDPYIPTYWGSNNPGMQSRAEIPAEEIPEAEFDYLMIRDYAVLGAVALMGGPGYLKDEALQQRIVELKRDLGYKVRDRKTPLHKQVASRGIEPYMWQTIITSATDFSNFFALRANEAADPAIQRAAYLMKDAYEASTPAELGPEEWHLPLIRENELDMPVTKLRRMAVARCARVSYLTHDTGKRDIEKDLGLYHRLRTSGHMSPFEHVARPMTDEEYAVSPYQGNFHGWHQHRKDIPYESDYGQALEHPDELFDYDAA